MQLEKQYKSYYNETFQENKNDFKLFYKWKYSLLSGEKWSTTPLKVLAETLASNIHDCFYDKVCK